MTRHKNPHSRNTIGPQIQATQARIVALEALAERVARLNPDAGFYGAGMLASLVEQARHLTKPASNT